MALLEVKNLSTYFYTRDGVRKAVDGVSFSVGTSETLGLVGESGSGKSVTALSILRLVDEPGRITGGEVIFDGKPLFKLSPEEMRAIRGKEISMVFQEPLTALNPVMTVGEQIIEQILAHVKIPKREAKRRALGLLGEVHLPDPERIFYDYPHRLSGGMRQRAMIAMALSLNPKLLIADEPTTALDVTIQAEILELFREIREKHNMSVLFITHDFGIVAQLAESVCVMKKGKIVEAGGVDDIFYSPKDAYTKELLAAVPKIQFKGFK
ncbi:MAG: ABC transporter ATP-binding protein [Candidatus Omnitrophica bacterium]|nr:ABC transporter ATP-binding protein [Candidatus Omnitrophota bacterium]MBU4487602.1 ABC transporter ATP-binding protein [Candidatus Omnitrophota bacterium]MCG2705086.1 ABC transporter ATP-binding protein [Candidatus Omnitrophota bacterium]